MPLIEFSAVTSPLVRKGQAYWAGKKRGRRLPARADIDPTEIPNLLPYLLLSDVLRDPFDIRFRLAGTQVVAMNNFDLTGKRLNAGIHQPEWRDYWLQVYRGVAESGEPAFGADCYAYRDRSHVDFEWCLLPLAADGETVDMILEVEAYPEGARPGSGLPYYVAAGDTR